MRTHSKKLLTLLAAVVGAPALMAGDVTIDFNTDLGAAVVSGSAKHVASGGYQDSGYVSITDAVGSQQGGLTLPDIDAGGPQGSFTISFRVQISGGGDRPADGMSINIVPVNDAIINGNVGEEGPGRGLTISFDTWDNGGESPTAPDLDVKYNGITLADRQSVGVREGGRAPSSPIYRYNSGSGEVDFNIFTGSAWEPVVIDYRSTPQGGGLLDVSYKGHLFFDDLPVTLPVGAYRIVLGARTGGAFANQWVDEFRIVTGGLPQFNRVTRTFPTPNGAIFGDQNMEVDIANSETTTLNTSTVSAKLNGVELPTGALSFASDGAGTTTVTINPAADLPRRSNQTLELTFGTGVGAETATLTLPFIVSPITSDTFFIETEDIDFDAGQYLTEAQAPDYPGGAYATAGLPLLNTDYVRFVGDNGNNEYRLGEDPNIGMVSIGDRVRTPTLTRTTDFKLGWNDGGEWQNYTRDFPANGQNYEVWARMSSGGGAMAASLGLVQNNQVDIQAVGQLGRFDAPATGNWDSFVFVPLRQGDQIANVVLRGKQVVRYTTEPGASDNNYLAFVPTPAQNVPAIVTFSPTDGVNGRGTVSFTATIVEQTDVIDPATVRVTLGGTEIVAAGAATKGGQVITATGTFDNFGYFQSRNAVVTFTQGGQTRTITIPVSSGGGVTYRRYDGIGGTAWQDVVNNAKYINNLPDQVKEIPRFEHDQTNPNLENFGGHLIAYFKPPTTAGYQFNISADDGAALWLSTDDQPSNKVLIATQSGWSGFRAFNTQADQAAGSTPAERVSPMINLEAGRRYYIEAIYHEGGGGDNVSVTYRNSTATPWVNGTPGLSEVEPFTGAAFDVLPQPVNSLVGRTVSFTGHLVAEQAGEITYQWLRGGDPVEGATTGTLTLGPLVAGDDGAMISLRATVNGQTFTSPAVRLTVNQDAVAPTIASVRTRNFHELAVVFSEEVQQLDATSITINNGITVTAVDHDLAFPRNALLTVAGAAAGSGLTEGTTYTLTLANVRDLAGNPGTATATVTPVFSTRFAEVEYFRATGGAVTVASLTGHAKFPQAPDEVVYNSLFEAPGTGGGGIWENYGASIHGFFIPPQNGAVIFFMSTDDNGELWLSTDENPANKVLIAREPVWNGVRAWLTADRRPNRENVSQPIEVVGGNRYYIELLYKEGGGGDNGAATYMYATETEDPANGTAPRIRGNAVGVVVNGAGRSVTLGAISGSPILQGRSGALTATATASPEGSTIGYQWLIKRPTDEAFTEIDGANSATLNVGPVTMEDEGTQYRLLAFTLGASATRDITLDVTPDTVPPAVVGQAAGIRYGANAADVGVVFNEQLDATSAGNVANYTSSIGTVESVTYFPQDNGVAVRITGVSAGQSGNLTITGVRDPYNNPSAAVTLPFTVHGMSWVGVGGNEPGSTQPEGVVALSDDDFDVISGGLGQWASYDESTFVYEQVTGNFDKKVRVAFQDSSSQWARAGLIVRENLDAGKPPLVAGEDPATVGFSRYQKVHVNPSVTAMGTAGNNNFELNRRTTRGGATDAAALSNGGAPAYPNVWVRLKREGDVLTMYRSSDGLEWLQLGTTTMTGLASTVYVGPDYSPENANINPVELRRSWLAQFRDYGNVGPVDPDPTPNIVSVEDTATGLRITFVGRALYSADSVTGPWTIVNGATSPHDVTVPAGAGAKFYRAGNPAP